MRIKAFNLSLLLVSLVACSGTYKHKISFNPQEPIRVAVLPFVQVDEEGKIISSSEELALDGLPLFSSKSADSPSQYVRKLVQSELERTSFDIVSPGLVDVEIPHHGFSLVNGMLDLKKIHQTKPSEFCKHFLDCDAVLIGRVTHWERNYYGVQSVNTVGVDLRLISARDNKVLFESSAKDSEQRGILKGPTGYASLVVEPVRGLDAEVIEDLSERVVKDMLKPLQARERPEFLKAQAPAIFAVSHDAQNGLIRRNEPLVVILFGTPAMSASFSIGDAIQSIPMIEQSPGQYYGEFFPLATDSFERESVVTLLRDQYNRVTSRQVEQAPVTLR